MRVTFAAFLSALLAFTPFVTASGGILQSRSLASCQKNSSFSASLFDVLFTADDGILDFNITGVSTVQGNVSINLIVFAYGLKVYTETINPCESDLEGLCPMQQAPLNIKSNTQLPADSLKKIPGIAYTVPDLDAKVQVYFNLTATGESVACVEAELSNGKTVFQTGVGWSIACVSGLALLASAVTAGLGHSNTAAHVAANAMALFGYFQAQAFIGMTAVSLPPVVSAWTQNFQWSMGIIRVGFLQRIATWYQRATGGTPTAVLSNLSSESVQVQKRGLDVTARAMKLAIRQLQKNVLGARSNSDTTTTTDSSTTIIVRGIERVGFRAGIEESNIFMTGYIIFVVFVMFTIVGVLLFKGVCELLTRAGRMKGDKFKDFRNGWTTVLKGIMFRIVLIGFPQMVVLCFWEFTRRDSSAIMVLAIFTIFAMLAILTWAASKVIRLAKRSIAMHKNPAYILYSDPVSLNKWGFLYVQFKATAYFWIVPALIYILVKGLFVALAQNSGVVQAVAFVVIEAVYLIAVCVMRPYMDKKTNGFNIAICAINFVSSVFLLVFTEVFNQPGIVTGAMGVIFFVYNAIFSLVLLIIVLIASIIAIFAKNPDTRYQPMRDDRGSFIKSSQNLNTELDALGATARGESRHHKSSRLDDDEDSWSGASDPKRASQQQPSYLGSRQPSYGHDAPRSPGLQSEHHAPPSFSSRQGAASPYNDSRNGSFRGQGASPSPWQRGAGYD